jgi:leucyl aminopeptidase
MKIKVKKGDITTEKTSALVINLFEGVKIPGGATGAVDKKLNNQISKIIAHGDFKGKLNEILLLHTFDFPWERVLIVGLGKQEEFNLDIVRQVSGTVTSYLGNLGVNSYSTILHGGGIGGLDVKDAAQALTEGAILGSYKFNYYKNEKETKIEEVTILERDETKIKKIEDGVKLGEIIANNQCLARDLANTPANEMTPSIFERKIKELINEKIKMKVLEKEECEKLGMNAFLAVAKGSDELPKFIILEYKNNNSAPIVLAGKGITFDSGGISLKPSKGMEEMKGDMTGAAVSFAVLKIISQLNIPINFVTIIPLCENLPSGKASKPGDIVKSLSGKTIEIVNTDAEGRLILADALSYATKYKPELIIDVATLTGAAKVALGTVRAAVMSNKEELIEKIKISAQKSGELVWPLPLGKEYKYLIKSDIADMKNVGEDGTAGTIVGGIFLQEFVNNFPWIHIDIAAVDYENKGKPYIPKGHTAFGVRLITEFIMNYSKI